MGYVSKMLHGPIFTTIKCYLKLFILFLVSHKKRLLFPIHSLFLTASSYVSGQYSETFLAINGIIYLRTQNCSGSRSDLSLLIVVFLRVNPENES